MRFEFATAGNIVFGPGTLSEVPAFAAEKGKHFFVVTGRRDARAAPLLTLLDRRGLAWTPFNVTGEPTTDMALAAVEAARHCHCDAVIGIGGGSALDAAKVVAALLTNPGKLTGYLEVVGEGLPLTRRPAPLITVPTTAGTGAEVTRNAVLGVPEKGVKVSMRSLLMRPDLVVVDPRLTDSMPPAVTAATGMDALTQLLEAFVSNAANPITDGFCREGLQRAGSALERAFRNGGDPAARDAMSLASLFGGLALANARLGAVHGLAGPLGGMLAAPHGFLCAALLPRVAAANVAALRSRAPGSPALARYDEAARILTGAPGADAAAGITWIAELCGRLRIPSLSTLGLKAAMLPSAADNALRSSSMKGNPLPLTRNELMAILEEAL